MVIVLVRSFVIVFCVATALEAAAHDLSNSTRDELRALADAHLLKTEDLSSPKIECSTGSHRRPQFILDDRSDAELAETLEPIQTNYANLLRFRGQRTKAEFPILGECGLRDIEIGAIVTYTASGYELINRSLWENDIRRLIRYSGMIRLIESGLEKLKPYEGFVRRGVGLTEPARAAFARSSMIHFRGFSSSSIGRGFNSPDRMLILSKTCRYIAPFAVRPSEKEVLCYSNMVVKVHYVDRVAPDQFSEYHRYILEEASDSEGILFEAI